MAESIISFRRLLKNYADKFVNSTSPIVDVRPRPGGAGGDVHLAPQPEFVTEIMHSPDPPRVQGTEPDSERNDGSALP